MRPAEATDDYTGARQAEQLVYEASQTIPDTERLIEQTENQISLLLGNNPGPIPRGAPLTQKKKLSAVPARLLYLQVIARREIRVYYPARTFIARNLSLKT